MAVRFGIARHRPGGKAEVSGSRLLFLRVAMAALLLVLVGRLFIIQVLSHDHYAALATDQHYLTEKLFPERGAVYVSNPRAAEQKFPIAVNKSLALVYADTRGIDDSAAAAKALAPLLGLDEAELLAKLAAKDDPYVPLARQVSEEAVNRVRALGLASVHITAEPFRYYPEGAAFSHLTGFVGFDAAGQRVGRYGIEGFWNRELTGKVGYIEAETDPVGRWIGIAERDLRPATDGAEILLTIDRNIQYYACENLAAAVERHGATGGAVVILEPKTGAVLALCGYPNFDPNAYSAVKDMRAFNDPAIFYSYEPGSIMKAITMAAALDADKVLPYTTYNDEGVVKIGPYSIRNSDGKANGIQTMTQVLEKSLNTGAIFAADRLGPKLFRQYVEAFGFGAATGIELDSEAAGDISSISKKGDIWTATASFGQGITTTPIQMAAAYAALANGGKLVKPYVVKEIRRSDGMVVRTEPQVVRQVITKRASTLVGGMLVRVVENGHGKAAGVNGYYVAGKTGTAQISKANGQGYEENAFIGSFVGYAPVDDPAFVMLTKIDRPQDVIFAESSAAPLFGEIASFLLQYLQIPPDRPAD
jgi:cell division protein FtsI/penicillin-binding protein 2